MQLKTFLRIYKKARKECYPEYMLGAKALYEWLDPVSIPRVETIYSSLITANYEIQQLAELIFFRSSGYSRRAIISAIISEELKDG